MIPGRGHASNFVECGGWCLVALVLLVAEPTLAQQRASILGLVTDTSGAVLPGVTVEAASPVLIEKVRSAVTDASGRYTIIDLRPGDYTVSFELAGFNRAQREGIVLQGAFAAQVNMQLSIGSLEETITVTGASPVVDVQSTQNQSVLNRDIIDVLPAARTMQGGASLVPGVSFYSQGFRSEMSVHGSTAGDQHIYFDGMNIGQNLTGTGSQANGVNVNELAQSELVYDAGAQTAETALGGVRMDSIPREGGNAFSGIFRTFGSRGAWQNDNITDELRPFIARGNAVRPQLRGQLGLRRAGEARQTVVPARAARDADQQHHSAPAAVHPAGRRSGVRGVRRTALDGPPDVSSQPARQDRLRVLQVAGRHAAV